MNEKEGDIICKDYLKAKGFLAGDKTWISEIIHPNNDKVNLPYSLAYGSLEIQHLSVKHVLKNEELYIILSGKGRLFIGEAVIEVEKGSTILVPGGKEQWLENTGTDKLTFFCIVSPPWTLENEDVLE